MSFLGIVAALPEEAKCLTGGRAQPESLLSISDLVWLRLCGIGRERAASAARSLLQQGASAVMSWGTVAGLVPELRAGDLVIPTKLVAANGQEFRVDGRWHQRVCTRLDLEIHDCALAEATTVVGDFASKSDLARRTGAAATDMESVAVAQVAGEFGVSSLAIRVVVDPVSMTMPASAIAAVKTSGARDWWGLGRGVLRKPLDMVGLWRLAQAMSLAQGTLSAVAGCVGPEFLAFETSIAPDSGFSIRQVES